MLPQVTLNMYKLQFFLFINYFLSFFLLLHQHYWNGLFLADFFVADFLFVPPAKKLVEVSGAVKRPYTYEAKVGETVSDILKYAGGFSSKAFRDIVTLYLSA